MRGKRKHSGQNNGDFFQFHPLYFANIIPDFSLVSEQIKIRAIGADFYLPVCRYRDAKWATNKKQRR